MHFSLSLISLCSRGLLYGRVGNDDDDGNNNIIIVPRSGTEMERRLRPLFVIVMT